MNSTLERLIALQVRDSALRRLDEALGGLPARRAKAEGRLAAAVAALEAQRERLQRLAAERRSGEREVDALLAQEQKFQGQTAFVKTNEELWALKREIGQVQEKRSTLETAVLERMEEEQAGRRDASRLEGLVAEAAAHLERETRSLEEERERLEDEKTRLGGERAALVAEVAPELRARYERVRANRGDPSVVPLVRGACGGCLTAQPPQRLQEVRQGELLVVCEFCGRLIVGVEGDGSRPA